MGILATVWIGLPFANSRIIYGKQTGLSKRNRWSARKSQTPLEEYTLFLENLRFHSGVFFLGGGG